MGSPDLRTPPVGHRVGKPKDERRSKDRSSSRVRFSVPIPHERGTNEAAAGVGPRFPLPASSTKYKASQPVVHVPRGIRHGPRRVPEVRSRLGSPSKRCPGGGCPAPNSSLPGASALVVKPCSRVSTFSCDIGYSESPTASRASAVLGKSRDANDLPLKKTLTSPTFLTGIRCRFVRGGQFQSDRARGPTRRGRGAPAADWVRRSHASPRSCLQIFRAPSGPR